MDTNFDIQYKKLIKESTDFTDEIEPIGIKLQLEKDYEDDAWSGTKTISLTLPNKNKYYLSIKKLPLNNENIIFRDDEDFEYDFDLWREMIVSDLHSQGFKKFDKTDLDFWDEVIRLYYGDKENALV